MKRNYGIDFLRILSMNMVVILHVLGWGILKNVPPLGGHYWLSYLPETYAYCAVDCFALISGFVMWNSDIKLHKIIELWLQVTFYTVIITGIMFIAYPHTISLRNIVKAIFPVTTKQYWYISAYFGLYLFIPILNSALQNQKQSVLRLQLVALIIVTILFPTIFGCDPYTFQGGYSTIWLCVIYLLGGYISKYKIYEKFSLTISLILFLGTTLLTFILKFFLENITNIYLGHPRFGNVFLSYTSPTVVLSAVFLLITCANINFNNSLKKAIEFFAPTTLGVYIIHIHPLIKNELPVDFAKNFIRFNPLTMILLVFISAFLIQLICSLIEKLRIVIFKHLKIRSKIIRCTEKLLLFTEQLL